MKFLVLLCALLLQLLYAQEICAQQQSQTCVDLNTLINNRNPFALVNCTTLNEPTCDGITCSIPPGNIIETATLTLWPCTIPPIINIAVDSNATMLIGNFNFSESTNGSQIYLIHEGGVEVDLAVLDVDLKYSQMDTAVFSLQVNVTFNLPTTNTVVLFNKTDIGLDLFMCDNSSAVGLKSIFAGIAFAVVLSLMSLMI